MAELVYGAITSLDGRITDAEGRFDWAHPDEELHAAVTTSSGRSAPASTGAGCTR